jgi:PAS domain S-box-containing protein
MRGEGTVIRRSVSERELAEEICQRKDFYESLLKAQSDVGEGLLVVKDGRIRYANEAFCLISGYSASELTALPIFGELAVPDQRCLLEDRMRRGLHGETVENRYEAAILHRSGRRVAVDVAVRPVSEDNRFTHLVAIVHDITERKRLEEKLKSSLAALVTVHEAGRSLSSTLVQKEIGSRLLRIMLRVCDLNAAVINLQDEGMRWDVLAAAGPESLWRTANATAEAQLARLKALESKEHAIFSLEPAEECGMPLVGLCLPLVIRDRVIGVLEAYGPEGLAEKATVGTFESLARQAVSALENAQLYQKVAEHEGRLKDLVGKLLVAREEERRRVAYDLHDGLTQLAVAAHENLQAYADDRPPGSRSSQDKLDRALELVNRTVGEARRVIASLRPTSLDDLGLAAALRLQIDSLRAEGWEITYEVDLWEERLPAEIETSLYGVALEALTNVRKHAGTTQVHVTLTQFGMKICLRVRDGGCGFDGAIPLREVSVPGEQVGLCSMRERIALLDGEFMVHSQPGLGTSVVAEIPLPAATPAQHWQTPSLQSKTPSIRLLIADDHALVREGLQTMLASEPDLEVVGTAADGQEALELCHRLRPDLVLMDVRMPKMDGFAATRALKAEDPSTIILMLSAYADPDDLFEAVRAGAAGYVVKDTTKHDLIGAVRDALSDEHPLDQEVAMQLLQSLAGEGGQRTEISPASGKQAAPLLEPLTPRELEVLRLLAQGETNRQISQELVISAATVKVHVEHILAKLGVCDRTQAAVRASEFGLLTPEG